jgi:hypothetical protein
MDESRLLVQHAAHSRLSRRGFLRGGALAAGTLAGAGVFNVATALGAPGPGADPRPIPGGFDANFNAVPSNPVVHALPPGVGFDMSTITDFNGVVAGADIFGTANNGAYFFHADMRFMDGLYVGMDGRHRQGSFGFV